jgi:glycosyltransferase involved in cell wall biosynthesis
LPLVTVIIPNYNHAPYLKERIDSVVNQTYRNFELIILDDCSTDNSAEIIEQYRGHEKVKRIIYNEVNSGSPFKQWKKGIELAKSEYVWIAESDDIAGLDFLKDLTPLLDENQQCAFAFCDSTTDYNTFTDQQANLNAEIKLYTGEDFIYQHNINAQFVNASCVVFRKDKINPQVLLDFGNFRSSGDWLFWTSIALKGDVIRHRQILNFYRRHETSVSGIAYTNGKYLPESFKLMQYFKSNLGVYTSKLQDKKWGAAWARVTLQKIVKIDSLIGEAFSLSKRLVFYYIYYLVKYRFYNRFSKTKFY